jgi:hypothetical protein
MKACGGMEALPAEVNDQLQTPGTEPLTEKRVGGPQCGSNTKIIFIVSLSS